MAIARALLPHSSSSLSGHTCKVWRLPTKDLGKHYLLGNSNQSGANRVGMKAPQVSTTMLMCECDQAL